jgi:hypothetical protein
MWNQELAGHARISTAAAVAVAMLIGFGTLAGLAASRSIDNIDQIHFGSIATDAFCTSPKQCPLCVKSNQIGEIRHVANHALDRSAAIVVVDPGRKAGASSFQ